MISVGEVLVITGKGGAGKTTVCAALGAALSLRGRKVLLVDASFGLRGLDLPLGVENDILNTLSDVLNERCTPGDAMLEVPGFDGLRLLAAPQTRKPSDAGPVEMKILMRNLKKTFDYILIDSPSGIERGFLLAAAGADRGLVVLPSDKAGIRTSGRLLGLLQEEGLRENLLFFNRLLPLGEKDPVSPRDTEDLLGIRVLGAAADCRELAFLEENGLAFLKENHLPSARAFLDAADRLLGVNTVLQYPQVPDTERKSFLSRLFGA